MFDKVPRAVQCIVKFGDKGGVRMIRRSGISMDILSNRPEIHMTLQPVNGSYSFSYSLTLYTLLKM